MKTHALRLIPGQDLKNELKKFTIEKNINAGFIITCVGSLKHAKLRLADQSTKEYDKKFEIVSVVGTLSQDGIHIHISIADNLGKVIGGHLKENCTIHTTAEIIIGEIDDKKFLREYDDSTRFNELVIKQHKT